MKLFATYLLIFWSLQSFGQKTISLNDPYFIEIENMGEINGSIDIRYLKNPELHKEFLNNIEQGRNVDNEMAEPAFEYGVWDKKPGNYLLQNEYQTFRFTVDKNNQLSGPATATVAKRTTTYNLSIEFENDLVKSAIVKNDQDSRYTTMEKKDGISTIKHYDKEGNLGNLVVLRDEAGYDHALEITYYSNGNPQYQSDKLEGTQHYYFENGQLQQLIKDNSQTREIYEENGELVEKSYAVSDDENCLETYQNG